MVPSSHIPEPYSLVLKHQMASVIRVTLLKWIVIWMYINDLQNIYILNSCLTSTDFRQLYQTPYNRKIYKISGVCRGRGRDIISSLWPRSLFLENTLTSKCVYCLLLLLWRENPCMNFSCQRKKKKQWSKAAVLSFEFTLVFIIIRHSGV